MNHLNPLDHALQQRRRDMDAAFVDYDAGAATRRLADRIVQEQLLAALVRPGTIGPPRGTGFADAHAAQNAAAADLEHLCQAVVARPTTGPLLGDFVHKREAGGALVFGCLLYLTGRPAPAAFWWRYAAGADDVEAMRLLTLHHRIEGEPEDAHHWAGRLHAARPTPTPAETEGAGDPEAYVARVEPGIEEVDDPDLGEICRPNDRFPRLLAAAGHG
ncbi:hypothetical protein [Embleya hyalina]|uniref:Uncharacterized protein n=1 Tax=Embleya hyalina TaxID=516124 RepID=A0A401YCY0_9ACTN|nr:hypothetical protein [Embleya hyalina]GCD92469.1 hypothetical protein EHYA_00107 [Embleya hyalina]